MTESLPVEFSVAGKLNPIDIAGIERAAAAAEMTVDDYVIQQASSRRKS